MDPKPGFILISCRFVLRAITVEQWEADNDQVLYFRLDLVSLKEEK